MELERYQALVTAIEMGSLSAAAQKLGYTPSGISRMLAALEEETGFPLLRRSREGVLPTEACTTLLPVVRQLLRSGEECRRQAARIRGLEIGTVTVGVAYAACYQWLAKVLAEFQKEWPGIQVQLCSADSEELFERLRRRELDLCLIAKHGKPEHWMSIRKDTVVAWLPAKHPLAAERSVPLRAFTTEAYIRVGEGKDAGNGRIFSAQHLCPNLCYTAADAAAAHAMVGAGLGIAMNLAIESGFANGKVVCRPVRPEQAEELGFAALREPTPAALALFNFIRPRLAGACPEQELS